MEIKSIYNMKQPELGRKIFELRKQKGLTQEELVEKCNISVRTIQRIEAGDVTPRSFTVKTILEVLGYNLDQIAESNFRNKLKKAVLIEDEKTSIGSYKNQLALSWILGLLYFVFSFIEFGIDVYWLEHGENPISNIFYIVFKIILFVSYLFFMRGFILLGNIYKIDLLKIAAFILIFIAFLFYSYDVISLYNDFLGVEYTVTAKAIIFGGFTIVFGVALLRLSKPHGNLANIAGGFEILAGVLLLTIIFAFVGLIMLNPAQIIEIIILFKSIQMIENNV